MSYILLPFFYLFSFCESFDIIPLSNFGSKTVNFTKKEDFHVFSYNNEGKLNSEVTFVHNFYDYNYPLYIYIYKNKSKIAKRDGGFIDYDYYNIASTSSYFSIITNNITNGLFYLVVYDYYSRNFDFNLSVRSSEAPPYTIPNKYFYCEFPRDSNKLTYVFQISSKNYKYINYGFKSDEYGRTEITVYQNNNLVYHSASKFSEEGHINSNNTNDNYLIYLTLTRSKTSSKKTLVYFALSNYYNAIEVDINTNYIQEFRKINNLNLILDMTPIKKLYRVKIEYSVPYVYYSIKYDVQGYKTDDPNIIGTINGTAMEIIQDKKDKENNTFYILKDSNDLKKIIIKFPNTTYPEYFGVKYGYQEYYYGKNVLASFSFGLGLSLPNVIFQIYRKARGQNTAPWYCLFMNILLHFAYGNLLAMPLHIGGKVSLIIGGVFFGLYFVIFVCMGCVACSEKDIKLIFKQLYMSSKDFVKYRILDEVFSFNRKLPPRIEINASASHEESREILKEFKPYQEAVFTNDYHVWSDGYITSHRVFDHMAINYDHINTYCAEWKRVDEGGGKLKNNPGDKFNNFVKDVEYRTKTTWTKKAEYKYTSWKDDTKHFRLEPNKSIITANFDFRVKYDESAEAGRNKFINELYEEGRKSDKDLKHYEESFCDDLIKSEKCYVNYEEYFRVQQLHQKKYLFLGILLFILGYSSIMDSFFYCEEYSKSFVIEKLLSDDDIYKAKYMQEDESFEPFERSGFGNQIDQHIDFQGKKEDEKKTELLSYS